MGHVFKKTENSKKKEKVVLTRYASVHQKVARLHSGNTITAKAFLRKQDKNGAERDAKK